MAITLARHIARARRAEKSRAILLVKSREGLTDDRLNGRYGLTGKPTLAQQGIAGSLSASFKAGQGVAMANLRSLNEKIREAQKALQSAQGNLGATDDTLDDMENERDKAQQLIGSGLWERMWRGIIDPFSFFAAKVMEDESYKLMAGEPGYPVIDEMPFRATAPICRVPYWDPILKINLHPMMANYTPGFEKGAQSVAFLNDPNMAALADGVAREAGNIYTLIGQLAGIALLYATMGGRNSAFAALSSGVATHSLETSPLYANMLVVQNLELQAMFYVVAPIVMVMTALLTMMIVGNVGEFGGDPDHVEVFYQSPRTYTESRYWINLMVGLDLSILQSAVISYISMNGTILTQLSSSYAVAGAIAACTASFGTPAYPAARAALGALVVGITTSASLFDLHFWASLGMLITGILMAMCAKTTRNNGDDVPMADLAKVVELDIGDDKDQMPRPVLSHRTNWNTTGVWWQWLGVYSDGAEAMTELLNPLMMVNKYLSITTLIAPVIDFVASKTIYGKSEVITEYDGNSTRVKIQHNTTLEDWYGVSKPQISFKFNDVAAGVEGADTYPAIDHVGVVDMRADVYDYDYFGAERKIKLFEKAIDRTVVIRAKSSSDSTLGKNESIENHAIGGAIWYGICVLVRFVGESKLYLLWERNAYFNARHSVDDKADNLPHAEQMIYNYDRSALPNAKPITSTRQGALEYYYCEYETEDSSTLIQFRPVASRKENWLAGQLINTEYVFGGDIALIYPPNHGTTEGDISSYAQQR